MIPQNLTYDYDNQEKYKCEVIKINTLYKEI